MSVNSDTPMISTGVTAHQPYAGKTLHIATFGDYDGADGSQIAGLGFTGREAVDDLVDSTDMGGLP